MGWRGNCRPIRSSGRPKRGRGEHESSRDHQVLPVGGRHPARAGGDPRPGADRIAGHRPLAPLGLRAHGGGLGLGRHGQGPDARPLGHRHPGCHRHPVHDPGRRAHRRTDRVPDAHRRRGARGLRREQGQEEPVLPARARSTGRPPPPARRLDRRRPPRGGGDRRPAAGAPGRGGACRRDSVRQPGGRDRRGRLRRIVLDGRVTAGHPQDGRGDPLRRPERPTGRGRRGHRRCEGFAVRADRGAGQRGLRVPRTDGASG